LQRTAVGRLEFLSTDTGANSAHPTLEGAHNCYEA